MKSPFKFLDAFKPDDRDAFFGREEEIEALYRMLNKNRLILVYGQSGTGKTSLVQCGLASRFAENEWLPLFIRRHEDINLSVNDTLQKTLGMPLLPSVNAMIEEIFANYLRPVYLIFDQFEELFILGNEIERQTFFKSMEALYNVNLPCRVLFIVREEYLAWLYSFEKVIPALFDRRLRVEPMNNARVRQVLLKSFFHFNISLEDTENNLQQIVDNVSAGKQAIQLPYLQVYLDQLWREDFARTYPQDVYTGEEVPPLTFRTQEIDEFGIITDVLSKFLQSQKEDLQRKLTLEFPTMVPRGDEIKLLLDMFVTSEGTKCPVSLDIVNGMLIPQPKNILDGTLNGFLPGYISHALQLLEQSRILRFVDGTAELAHDALADLIDKERSDEDRQINEVRNRLNNAVREFRLTGEYLSRKQLLTIEDILPKLQLSPELMVFVRDSQADATAQEDSERHEAEHRAKEAEERAAIEMERRTQAERLQEVAEKEKNKSQRTSKLSFVLMVFATIASIIAIVNNSKAIRERINATNEKNSAQKLARASQNMATTLKVNKYDQTLAFRIAEYNFNNHQENPGVNKLYEYFVSDTPHFYYSGIFSGHISTISSIVFSPDGHYILTGSWDNSAKLWSVSKPQEPLKTFFGNTYFVSAVAFSANGKYILTGSWDGTAKLWEISAPQTPIATFEGHSSRVSSVAFSPDSKFVLTGSWDKSAKLWEISKPKMPVVTFDGFNSGVTVLTFSPDGKYILAGINDGAAKLYSVKSSSTIKTFSAHSSAITSSAFSLDGQFLLTGSKDQTVKMWRVAALKTPITTLPKCASAISAVAFSSDGKRILISSLDSAKMWLVSSPIVPISIVSFPEKNVSAAAFSPDGQYVLLGSTDNSVKLYSFQSSQIEKSVQFSLDELETAGVILEPEDLKKLEAQRQ